MSMHRRRANQHREVVATEIADSQGKGRGQPVRAEAAGVLRNALVSPGALPPRA
jgi:hypothetical protein